MWLGGECFSTVTVSDGGDAVGIFCRIDNKQLNELTKACHIIDISILITG